VAIAEGAIQLALGLFGLFIKDQAKRAALEINLRAFIGVEARRAQEVRDLRDEYERMSHPSAPPAAPHSGTGGEAGKTP
jgi:hypothetical protein